MSKSFRSHSLIRSTVTPHRASLAIFLVNYEIQLETKLTKIIPGIVDAKPSGGSHTLIIGLDELKYNNIYQDCSIERCKFSKPFPVAGDFEVK